MRIAFDMRDLLRKIPQIAQAMDDEADDQAGKLAADIAGDLMLETPRDEGTAANGWQLDDSGPQKHITNNIVYIGELNRGHSQQASAGYVEAICDRHTKL